MVYNKLVYLYRINVFVLTRVYCIWFSKIRDAICANGPKVTLAEIDLVDPTIQGKPIKMYVNRLCLHSINNIAT